MRIVFMGTPDFAAVSLQRLLDERFDVVGVFTQPDKPKNRGMKLQPSPVKEIALAAGLPVFQPAKMRDGTALADLQSLRPDILVVVAYGRILPDDLLAVAPYGAVNVHGSLLPKYRGRVPINWAIIKGETETGATLHEMVAKPDAGRIVDQEKVAINPDDTAADVFARVTGAAAAVLDRSLPRLIDGTAGLREQDLAAGSYYGGRKPEDGVINWHDSARSIHNLVRAVAPPYPGATTRIGDEAVKITRTRLAPDHFQHHNPAKLNVGSDTVIALCGDGRMLRIIECEIDGLPHNEVMLAARLGVGLHELGGNP